MATIDFRIIVNITPPAFYSYTGTIPHSDEEVHHFGLREPLRQNLLDVLNASKDQLGKLCAMSFAVAGPPGKNLYQMEIGIYEYQLRGEWADLCQTINNIMALSPSIHSIQVYPLSSRSSTFYQDNIPNEFDQHNGRIPYGILLGTAFNPATQAIGANILNSLRNGIMPDGYLVTNDKDLVITISR